MIEAPVDTTLKRSLLVLFALVAALGFGVGRKAPLSWQTEDLVACTSAVTSAAGALLLARALRVNRRWMRTAGFGMMGFAGVTFLILIAISVLAG
jgi:Kef-type K+ transport system membrane component KefB